MYNDRYIEEDSKDDQFDEISELDEDNYSENNEFINDDSNFDANNEDLNETTDDSDSINETAFIARNEQSDSDLSDDISKLEFDAKEEQLDKHDEININEKLGDIENRIDKISKINHGAIKEKNNDDKIIIISNTTKDKQNRKQTNSDKINLSNLKKDFNDMKKELNEMKDKLKMKNSNQEIQEKINNNMLKLQMLMLYMRKNQG